MTSDSVQVQQDIYALQGHYISRYDFMQRISAGIDAQSQMCFANLSGSSHTYWASSAMEAEYFLDRADAPTYIRHFCPNQFFRGYNSRQSTNLRHLHWMVFDFERLKPDGTTYTAEEVAQLVYNLTGFAPTFVASSSSSGHYHVYLHIQEMTGHAKSLSLFSNIQETICVVIGADRGALGPNHLFRIPTMAVWVNLDAIQHDISELKAWYKRQTAIQGVRRKHEGYKSSTSFKTAVADAESRLLAGKVADGASRNEAGFTAALVLRARGWSRVDTEEYLMSTWLATVAEYKSAPYRLTELRHSIKSAYSGRYHGPKSSKVYELATGQAYIPHRKRERLSDRKSPGQTRRAIVDYLRSRGGQYQGSVAHCIAAVVRLGYAYQTVEKQLYQLRDEGVLAWQTRRGRGATCTITLRDGVVVNESSAKVRTRAIEKYPLRPLITSGMGSLAELAVSIDRSAQLVTRDTVPVRSDISMGTRFKKARFHVTSGPASLFERVNFVMSKLDNVGYAKHFRDRVEQRKIPKAVLNSLDKYFFLDWVLVTAEVRTDTGKFVNSTWECVFEGEVYWVTIGLGNVAETIIRKDCRDGYTYVSSGPMYEFVEGVNEVLMNQGRGVFPSS